MECVSKNHLWNSIVPRLQTWLIHSQIKQLQTFQCYWNILTIMEKRLLIRQMINHPQNLCFTWNDGNKYLIRWTIVNNTFQYIQKVSFCTCIQQYLQQNDATTKHTLYLGVINQIKRIFHFDLAKSSLKSIKILISCLLIITPVVFSRFIIDVVYRPIWISLDECPQKFPEVSLYPSDTEIGDAIFKLRYKSPVTTRLHQLHYILIRKCWNHSQSKIEIVEYQIEKYLNLLSQRLQQL